MKKKTFAVIISASLLASMGTGAFAATKLQEIKAQLNTEVKVKVDGTPTQLIGTEGEVLVPIIYNGDNYLPVRAVSNALKVAVDYDPQTNTIILGEKVDGISIAKGFDDMYHTKDPVHTTYQGKDYKEVYFNTGSGNRSVGFMLYPKKEHQKLYLQVAAAGEDITDFVIKDSDQNIILKQVNVIKAEDGLTTIEVDIGGVETLYVYASAKKDGTVFVPLTTSYYK